VSPAAMGQFMQPKAKFAGTPGEEICFRQSNKTLERRYGSASAAATVLGYNSPAALRKAIRKYCG
jgi:hypothetical protein